VHHLQVDCQGQADGLFETALGVARALPAAFQRRINDQSPALAFPGKSRPFLILAAGCLVGQDYSSPPSLSPSKSWIGDAGMTVEIACL
jgi:hypothetical protein